WHPEDETMTLTLAEGKVAVSGCSLGDPRPVLAGETLRASCRTNEFRIARTSLGENHVAKSELGDSRAPIEPRMPVEFAAEPHNGGAPAAPMPPLAAPSPQPSAASATAREGRAGDAWQAMAKAGKLKEAFASATEHGFDTELARDNVDDLLLL